MACQIRILLRQISHTKKAEVNYARLGAIDEVDSTGQSEKIRACSTGAQENKVLHDTDFIPIYEPHTQGISLRGVCEETPQSTSAGLFFLFVGPHFGVPHHSEKKPDTRCRHHGARFSRQQPQEFINTDWLFLLFPPACRTGGAKLVPRGLLFHMLLFAFRLHLHRAPGAQERQRWEEI